MDALGLLRSVTPKTVESREADAAMMAEDEALEKHVAVGFSGSDPLSGSICVSVVFVVAT